MNAGGRKPTCDETVLNDGNRNSNLPKRVGWLGYWVRQYSSSAHWDFSCSDSMWETSERPQASEKVKKNSASVPS